MDIKLKKYNKDRGIKAMAFILCVVFFVASLVGAGLAIGVSSPRNFNGSVDDLLLYNSYEESVVFQREFDTKLNEILYMLNEYKSEEYIKSGKSIQQERLDQAIENLFYEMQNQNASVNTYGGDYGVQAVREAFKTDHAEEIAKIKESLIMDALREYEQQKQRISGNGFTYYATDGTYVLTNLEVLNSDPNSNPIIDTEQFSSMPAYLIYQDDHLIKAPSSSQSSNQGMRNYDQVLENRLDNEYNQSLKVYFAFDDTYLATMEGIFTSARAELMKWIPMAAISALLSLAMLIYLIIVTGKKDDEGDRPIYRLDRVFTEIQLAVITGAVVLGGAGFLNFLYSAVINEYYYNGSVYVNENTLILPIILSSAIGLVAASIGLLFILSCVRNLKASRFLRNSLLYKVIMAMYNGIKSIYHGGSVMTKVVLIALAICILSATIIGALLAIFLVIVFAPRWVKRYEEIKRGVDQVKSGNLAYKIPLNGAGELDQLAKGINEISEASNIAIQNELKTQRMKTDLISNVSHDLKTPLTSIITYVDLLKNEGLNSENALKYLEIIDQKSSRLQKLTEDLFDAAKASSGAIPVKFEKVEMMSLINQGLGEMADRISESGLEFIVSAKDERYYVRADGQLLWRVVENLLNNVLKYAQENSRVYIDLKEAGSSNGKDPSVVLEIKNISKTALNIDSEELMERFKRGDESRTTEGSGLGLAIAKDLVRLQDGLFEIKIDGDLFKATVQLPKL